MRRAVIDVGSNAVVLAVCERRGAAWTSVLDTSTVTALGEGLQTTQRLDAQSIERTLYALKRAWTDARACDARVQAWGTMALRAAQNADLFLRLAEEQGTPVRVLAGEDEARLGLLSVALDPTFEGSRVSLIDVGGHSTEVGTYDRDERSILFMKSLPIGTLRLRSFCEVDGSLAGLSLLRASAAADDAIGFASRPRSCGTVVAVGASATNLVTLSQRMSRWNPSLVHGSQLTYEHVSRFVARLAPMTDEQRAGLVGLEKGREFTIHLGAILLERCLQAFRAESLRVSVRGWRHAIIEEDSYWEESAL
jgi:exopolyphosphatase/guanosine-5'-triphosphate,3'-diphosphate pyrophosphatase